MTKLADLINQHDDIVKEILEEIEKLPTSGYLCGCENMSGNVFVTISSNQDGYYTDIVDIYCTKCGGYINNYTYRGYCEGNAVIPK